MGQEFLLLFFFLKGQLVANRRIMRLVGLGAALGDGRLEMRMGPGRLLSLRGALLGLARPHRKLKTGGKRGAGGS